MKLIKWLKEPVKDYSNGWMIFIFSFALIGFIVVWLFVVMLSVAIIQGNTSFTPEVTFWFGDKPELHNRFP